MTWNIIAEFLLSTIRIAILMIPAMALFYVLMYEIPYWDDAPAEQLEYRDNIYRFVFITPVIAISLNLLWAYRAVQRKNAQEFEY